MGFFLSFRQNYRYSIQCTCIHRYLQDQRMQSKHVNFHKIYTYSTTCFNYTYLLIFILSMITSKHKMRRKSFVLYYTALLYVLPSTYLSQQHHGLITGTLPYCWNSLQSEYYYFDSC